MPQYKADIKFTSEDGKEIHLTGTLEDADDTPKYPLDFMADFAAHTGVMQTAADWQAVFADAISQGASIHCLEQNTGVTERQFTSDGHVMRVFMPKGSYGMGHRSVNINLGKVQGPVNVSFEWMCSDPGTNLWVNGGGKWGPAIQYGPIQSGPTGGIRFMPTWSGGASTLGKQDLTCSIQNQPDGGQWLQPPYYGFRPIEYNHWYSIHLRMTGGGDLTGAPATVVCEYWKDSDPIMDYVAHTNNLNAQQGKADVMIDWTCFFGGTEQNKAPADAYFNYRNMRIWVEA